MKHSWKINIAEISAISRKFLDGHIGNKNARIYIIHHFPIYGLEWVIMQDLRILELMPTWFYDTISPANFHFCVILEHFWRIHGCVHWHIYAYLGCFSCKNHPRELSFFASYFGWKKFLRYNRNFCANTSAPKLQTQTTPMYFLIFASIPTWSVE